MNQSEFNKQQDERDDALREMRDTYEHKDEVPVARVSVRGLITGSVRNDEGER
jgi:hypothetical protein